MGSKARLSGVIQRKGKEKAGTRGVQNRIVVGGQQRRQLSGDEGTSTLANVEILEATELCARKSLQCLRTSHVPAEFSIRALNSAIQHSRAKFQRTGLSRVALIRTCTGQGAALTSAHISSRCWSLNQKASDPKNKKRTSSKKIRLVIRHSISMPAGMHFTY